MKKSKILGAVPARLLPIEEIPCCKGRSRKLEFRFAAKNAVCLSTGRFLDSGDTPPLVFLASGDILCCARFFLLPAAVGVALGFVAARLRQPC